jgi:hypothetical protein
MRMAFRTQEDMQALKKQVQTAGTGSRAIEKRVGKTLLSVQ